MYEFTHGGAWFKWSLLDAASKRLAAASFACTAVATIPIALAAGEWGHSAGYRAGYAMAGGKGAPPRTDHVLMVAAQPWHGWLVLAAGIAAALFWWRFSVRQDEMFNRVQNWTLGMAGAWTVALLACWIAVAATGAVAAPDALSAVVLFWVLLCGFWFAGVRRWG